MVSGAESIGGRFVCILGLVAKGVDSVLGACCQLTCFPVSITRDDESEAHTLSLSFLTAVDGGAEMIAIVGTRVGRRETIPFSIYPIEVTSGCPLIAINFPDSQEPQPIIFAYPGKALEQKLRKAPEAQNRVTITPWPLFRSKEARSLNDLD